MRKSVKRQFQPIEGIDFLVFSIKKVNKNKVLPLSDENKKYGKEFIQDCMNDLKEFEILFL